jgi:Ca2+-binding EF-hand superfamily protein
MMAMLGNNITLQEAQESVGKYDVDGNGKMNFYEFLDYLGF